MDLIVWVAQSVRHSVLISRQLPQAAKPRSQDQTPTQPHWCRQSARQTSAAAALPIARFPIRLHRSQVRQLVLMSGLQPQRLTVGLKTEVQWTEMPAFPTPWLASPLRSPSGPPQLSLAVASLQLPHRPGLWQICHSELQLPSNQ